MSLRAALLDVVVGAWRVFDRSAVSVAKRHLSDIAFEPVDDGWRDLHIVAKKVDGEPREPPYRVKARRYAVGGSAVLFVHCPAMRTPLPIGTAQKHELGAVVLEECAHAR